MRHYLRDRLRSCVKRVIVTLGLRRVLSDETTSSLLRWFRLENA